MQKLMLITCIAILTALVVAFFAPAMAEEIHFNNDIFKLKYNDFSELTNCYENEYFLNNETKDNWNKMVGIYYYPEISNPLKFADKECKDIESNEINVLLKFIENKQADKAALSYLQNGYENGKNFFEYNIFKYEKHPQKGMMALRYAIRYYFKNDAGIKELAQKVKEENDEYLQKIVESPIPPIIENKMDKQ